jgi:hypothetical protein
MPVILATREKPRQIVHETCISKITRVKGLEVWLQLVESLLCKSEALSSDPGTTEKQQQKQDIVPFAITCMNLDDSMLSKMNQTQKYCMISPKCGILKNISLNTHRHNQTGRGNGETKEYQEQIHSPNI